MKNVPGYSKVMTLGSYRTENALVGDVVVQEKIDGSQFGAGVNEDLEVVVRSHNRVMEIDAPDKMFQKAVDHVRSMENEFKSLGFDIYCYFEYLNKPKHNTLTYERVPKNNLVLFDCMSDGKWSDREELEKIASILNVDVIPELYRGIVTKEKIKELLDTDSYLGNEKVEGVVIKNYNQTILVGGQLFPLFTKYVREEFKERHNKEWKTQSPKGAIQEYVDSFKSEARWQKALQHLMEKGEIEHELRDIGKLVPRVMEDIKEEEIENIKDFLYNKFIGDITRTSIRGLPEWYKEKLLGNVK